MAQSPSLTRTYLHLITDQGGNSVFSSGVAGSWLSKLDPRTSIVAPPSFLKREKYMNLVSREGVENLGTVRRLERI